MVKTHEYQKQTRYAWEGLNQAGDMIHGETYATDTLQLKLSLFQQGIIIKRITPKPKRLITFKRARIKPNDIINVLRQLSTLLNAGIALHSAFTILMQSTQNPNLAQLLKQCKTDLESGFTLSHVLRQHKQYFSHLVCQLIEAGEKSGALEKILSQLVAYLETSASLKQQVKSACLYPATVLLVTMTMTLGLLLFVVPRFADIFQSFGAQLPIATRMVMAVSAVIGNYAWLLCLFGIFSIYLLKHKYKHSKQFLLLTDTWLLKCPIMGKIVQKACIARFTRTLSTTLSAGLPLVDSLACVSGATGNARFNQAASMVREAITTGEKLHMAFSQTGLFPNMVVQMLGVGEASGALAQMLIKIADCYEEEVTIAVNRLSQLLEPMMMIVLGIIIGGLLIALYMPIFKLGGVI